MHPIGELLAPQGVERQVARDSEHPRMRLIGHALRWPDAQSPQHCLLHDVFGKLEVGWSEHAAQARHQACVTMPEQVIDNLGRQRMGHGDRL